MMSGSRISSATAGATGTTRTASNNPASTLHIVRLMLTSSVECASVRERPQPQVVLERLPQSREPQRLRDQEEEDEPAEDDELHVRHHVGAHEAAAQPRRDVQTVGDEDGKQHHEGGAEEAAQDG